MTQLYWQVYKNLEHEFLALADVIYINDNQLDVYSMKIADLLMRTAVEAEALAKELYLVNGGDDTLSDEKMYFDSVCMDYLDKLWKLDPKKVIVVSPNVHIEKDENRILTPLHKAWKHSGSDWNRAYQAVKHNRVKCLKKGSIKHLLRALAALYVLNLYYKDEKIEKLTEADAKKVDVSFGSNLFAVCLHQYYGLDQDGNYEKKENYDDCIYIVDYESSSKAQAMDALKEANDFIKTSSVNEIVSQTNEKIAQGETPTKEWVDSKKAEAFSHAIHSMDYKLSQKMTVAFLGLRYNIVLNKQQY